MMDRLFTDRREAGRELAAKLYRYRDEHPLVLAIPRGGVPVGLEVAQALDAPLDLVLVRKIGAPFQPELAVGAVVDGEHAETVLNRNIVEVLRLPEEFIKDEAARQLQEIERRRKLYLGDRPRPRIEGRTAIVVDDGIATGATILAALTAVRRSRPRKIVAAAPVAPRDSVERLRKAADDVICLFTPEDFGGISQFYRRFDQLADSEVTDLLRLAVHPSPVAEPGVP